MPPSLVQEIIIGRFASGFALALAYFGATGTALAVDHRISPQTSLFYCSSSSVKPGDTLTLDSGTRGPLIIRDCSGTQANPIVIRNQPGGSGPTVIRRSSGKTGGFLLSCHSCIGVAIDGSYKWQGAPSGKTYGIKITVTGGSSPSAFLRIGGFSRFVTIRNVEIDGAWPSLASTASGIRVNDHDVKRNAHPGLWREGILIEHNYIHNVGREGMYIGPNYADGDLPLRNIEIRYNRVEDIGWEGINTKSMWAGENSVHHNYVRRTGKNSASASKTSQYSGIKNNAGTVKIYNNWVETTGQHGIQVWTQGGPKISEGRGPFEAHIWNNVIVDAGALWRSFMEGSYGISVGAQAGCEKPVPFIYNNTIVNSRQRGINLTSNVGAGFVRDNIVADAASNPVIAVPKFIDLINNRIGSVSQMEFVNPGNLDFRLKIGSPARNEGSSVFPDKDYHDVTRPKDGAADQGAFEGTSG
jgi:hypothetical protein